MPSQVELHMNLDRDVEMVEVYKALNTMKNRKAVGVDGKPIEVENFAESELYVPLLKDILVSAMENGIVASEFKDVIIAILFKKGDKMDCGNYRGLSLIVHFGKAIERFVQNRLIVVAEENDWFPEEQNGFRSNRSTIDSIFVSRTLSSRCREKGLLLFKGFIDLTKAYDKVNRAILWEILRRRGVPPKLLDLIIAIHEGAMAAVRVNGEMSEPFELKSGLKQGSVFAPLLFNIFFGAILFAIDRRLCGLGIQLKFHGW